LLLTGLQVSTVEQGLAFQVQGIHGSFTLLIVMQSEARVGPWLPPATCINARVLMASIDAVRQQKWGFATRVRIKGRVSQVTMTGIVIGDFYEPDRASMVRAHHS
jgi:hypothetical protein